LFSVWSVGCYADVFVVVSTVNEREPNEGRWDAVRH